ncbi:MAG: flagella basal body P-ring formation protein FlgA [Terriglobia bacterium]|nr:MAG: flagella basal body P-ring formation protein FlgA [Terriglobia bacterium]
MILLSSVLLAGCLAVGPASDRITAGLLAPEFSGMESVAPETALALAPAPGAVRIFRLPELRKLAARFGLTVPQNDICVQRPVAPLERERLQTVLETAMPGARIEILEFSRKPVPSGEIEFPPAALRDTPSGSLWNGAVRYGSTHRFSIWARVRARIGIEQVIASGDLRPGTPIAAELLRIETREESPSAAGLAHSIGEVAGKWPRVLIRAGSAIRTAQLQNPVDVTRGDTVVAEVRGAAHLEVAAVAEKSGAVGEVIPLRNPASQKRFLGRIAAKGKVMVEP